MKNVNPTATEPVDPFADPQLCPTDAAGIKTNGARFGCSRDDGAKWHGGIDLKADVGTKFKAIYSGRVTDIRNLSETHPDYKKGVGNFIIVRSTNFSIKYCHLKKIDVQKGDTVAAGDILGETGKSGNAFNVPFKHLHLEVSTDHFLTANNYVDPEKYLNKKYGANPNDPDHSKCPAFTDDELNNFHIEHVEDGGLPWYMSTLYEDYFSNLLLVPIEQSFQIEGGFIEQKRIPILPYNAQAAMNYASEYCNKNTNLCCQFYSSDCAHFMAHCLAAGGVTMKGSSGATCPQGLCIRAAELAAAFENASQVYKNVNRIDSYSDGQKGDYGFLNNFVRDSHAFMLNGMPTFNSGPVYAHTTNHCGDEMDTIRIFFGKYFRITPS